MRALIATRKGLFDARRGRDGWSARPLAFLGDPVSAVVASGEGRLHAALALGHFGVKLHRSEDGGASWHELPAPALPESAGSEHSVDLVWSLEAGGARRPGRLWAGTLPGALFRSEDAGESWHLVEGLWREPLRVGWMGGGYDVPGIHSISIDPRDDDRLAVAVSVGGVWHSRDGGASWALSAKGMVADYLPPELAGNENQQDPHRMVRCPAAPDTLWVQHHCGIWKSEDGGMTWRGLRTTPNGGFGFAVAVHPADPRTAWFAPAIADQCRVPKDGRFRVARTRDGGESFEELGRGLPEGPAWDLVYRHALDVAADGRSLIMGSTTGNLWASGDGGESWQHVSAHLPPVSAVRFIDG